MTHHDHGSDDHEHGHEEHHAQDAESLGVAVLTISTSRTLEDDPSGDAIVDLVEGAGDEVVRRGLVPDDRTAIAEWVEAAVRDADVGAVVTTGGTGLSPDDVTVPTVAARFDREITGFGEQFRALSAEAVGARAVLSDATAGLVDGVPVFCLPGSENAVELGVSELVLPTVRHVVGLQRDATHGERSEQSSGVDRRASDDGDSQHAVDGAEASTDGHQDLTHVDASGDAEMVDVGGKAESRRRAVATGTIRLQPSTVAAVRDDEIGKGDVLATARVGAVDAVKHTWETIPLCHQIPITNVETDFALHEDAVDLTVTVETVGRTGCEMEAIQGVTTGLGVVLDMVKAAEKDANGQYPGTRIEDVRIVEKVVERPEDGG